MAGLYLWTMVCMQGKDVLRVAIFQDIREVEVEVYVELCVSGGGWFGGGGMYPIIGCLHLSALLISVEGRKGNLLVIWSALCCGCVAI